MSFTVRDRRNGDWYWIHKAVYTKYASKIGAIGLALYNAYCHYANSETSLAYPSVGRLCKDLSISKQTVFKYNEILEKYKLIKIESGGGRKKVNEVYLLKIKVNLANKKVNEVDTEQEYINKNKTLLGVPNKGETPSFGNENINKILEEIKESLNLPVLDGSVRANRRYAYNLLRKFKGVDGVLKLIRLAGQDEWYKNNITSTKDLYYSAIKIIARRRGNGDSQKAAINATAILSPEG